MDCIFSFCPRAELTQPHPGKINPVSRYAIAFVTNAWAIWVVLLLLAVRDSLLGCMCLCVCVSVHRCVFLHIPKHASRTQFLTHVANSTVVKCRCGFSRYSDAAFHVVSHFVTKDSRPLPVCFAPPLTVFFQLLERQLLLLWVKKHANFVKDLDGSCPTSACPGPAITPGLGSCCVFVIFVFLWVCVDWCFNYDR